MKSIVPRYTREIPQRARLEAAKCKKCGHIEFPPRLVCSKCGHREFEPVTLKKSGTLLTYTIIYTPAEAFAMQAPFAVGIVELDDGVRLTTQIVDTPFDQLEIGRRVEIIFRRVQKEGHAGVLEYGYKAVVVD
jgi:uncharacterized OB-fold protein